MSLGPLVDVKTKLMQIRQKVGRSMSRWSRLFRGVVQMQADLAVQRKAEVVKLEEDRTRFVRLSGEMCQRREM